MKNQLKKSLLVIIVVMGNICAYAQDTKKLDVDIDVNKGDNTWYMQPWAWVVGGAVFILLLVALLRSNKK